MEISGHCFFMSHPGIPNSSISFFINPLYYPIILFKMICYLQCCSVYSKATGMFFNDDNFFLLFWICSYQLNIWIKKQFCVGDLFIILSAEKSCMQLDIGWTLRLGGINSEQWTSVQKLVSYQREALLSISDIKLIRTDLIIWKYTRTHINNLCFVCIRFKANM